MDPSLRISGRPYEMQVVAALQLAAENDEVWHWDDVPEMALLDAGILECLGDARRRRRRRKLEAMNDVVDRGIDALVRRSDGVYMAVQAKDRIRLGGGELGTFYEEVVNMRSAIGSARVLGKVYYSGRLDTGIPTKAMASQLGIEYVPHMFHEQPRPQTPSVPEVDLYSHQIEALDRLDAWARGPPNHHHPRCEGHDGWRGILACPPRTGKTMITGEHVRRNDYRHVLVFTPKLAYVRQTYEALLPFASNGRTFCCIVDSDHERDVGRLRERVDDPGSSCFLCVTFKSADVVEEIFGQQWSDNDLVVVDEFHNLSSADLRADTPLGRIVRDARRVLGVSGTPIDFGPEFLGPVLYSYTLTDAIRDGRVCDFRIWVPCVADAVSGAAALPEDVTDESDGDWALPCSMFLINGALRHGCRRTVCFLPPGGHADRMKKRLLEYATFQAVEVKVDVVSHDMSMNARDRILEEFERDTDASVIRVLVCVRLLEECIDLPSCDSTLHIFPALEPTVRGRARTVQRLMRAGTVRSDRPNKVAHTFVYGGPESVEVFMTSLCAVEDGLDGAYVRDRAGAVSTEYDDVGRSDDRRTVQRSEATVVDVVRRYTVGCQEARMRSLEELCQAVAAQWDPDKNEDVNPGDVAVSSNKKRWWLCDKGHSWQAVVSSRTKPDGRGGYDQGNGCPYCSGKRVTPETSLAYLCPVVAAQWDVEKNGDVGSGDVTVKTQFKAWWRCGQGHSWQAAVSNRTKLDGRGGYEQGSGCPYCSGKRVTPETSLAYLCPAVAAQWDMEKNGDVGSGDVTVRSDFKAWWRCDGGHSWQAQVSNRTKSDGRGGYVQGRGCPYCSRKLVTPETSLLYMCPDVAAQWDVEKNGDVRPSEMAVSSNKKCWWLCDRGHSWQAQVSNRTKSDGRGGYVQGRGCPYCSRKLVTPETSLLQPSGT